MTTAHLNTTFAVFLFCFFFLFALCLLYMYLYIHHTNIILETAAYDYLVGKFPSHTWFDSCLTRFSVIMLQHTIRPKKKRFDWHNPTDKNFFLKKVGKMTGRSFHDNTDLSIMFAQKKKRKDMLTYTYTKFYANQQFFLGLNPIHRYVTVFSAFALWSWCHLNNMYTGKKGEKSRKCGVYICGYVLICVIIRKAKGVIPSKYAGCLNRPASVCLFFSSICVMLSSNIQLIEKLVTWHKVGGKQKHYQSQ